MRRYHKENDFMNHGVSRGTCRLECWCKLWIRALKRRSLRVKTRGREWSANNNRLRSIELVYPWTPLPCLLLSQGKWFYEFSIFRILGGQFGTSQSFCSSPGSILQGNGPTNSVLSACKELVLEIASSVMKIEVSHSLRYDSNIFPMRYKIRDIQFFIHHFARFL